MLQSPIFQVNGEDPEAVAQVVRLAMDFRQEFKRDVFIDMYAYRRLGHNEGDEPSFTQPVLYRAIGKRQSVRDGYLEHLLKLNGVTREEADRIAARAPRPIGKGAFRRPPAPDCAYRPGRKVCAARVAGKATPANAMTQPDWRKGARHRRFPGAACPPGCRSKPNCPKIFIRIPSSKNF